LTPFTWGDAGRSWNGRVSGPHTRNCYRLNVFPIHLPSLKERVDDVPLLVEYFVDRYARKASKNFSNITNKTLQLFQAYDWPGNILG
jgi:transcriptional regulator with PAS, ATPase and Fis domain